MEVETTKLTIVGMCMTYVW